MEREHESHGTSNEGAKVLNNNVTHEHKQTHIYIYIYTYMYTYIYIYISYIYIYTHTRVLYLSGRIRGTS